MRDLLIWFKFWVLGTHLGDERATVVRLHVFAVPLAALRLLAAALGRVVTSV